MSDDFGVLDLEEIGADSARLNGGGKVNNFEDMYVPMPKVKPGQKGSVTVRILPPVKGGKLYQYTRLHTINGRRVHCPRPYVNGKFDWKVPCPICEHYSSLWKRIEKLGKDSPEAKPLVDEARSLKPVERYYYNAIVRQMTNKDGAIVKNQGPRILSVNKTLHTMIINAILGTADDPTSKLGNITDPKTGYDFVIRLEATLGEGFAKYESSGFARQASPLGEPEEVSKWVAELHDLTRLRILKPNAEVTKELDIHLGIIPDESAGFDVDKYKEEARKRYGLSATTSVPVAGNVSSTPVATADSQVAVAATTTAPAEDVPIEDDDFFNQLNDIDLNS